MLIKKLNFKKILLIIAFITIFTMLIIYPQKYSKSITNGLSIWFIYVLPMLFPYIFITKLMNSLNILNSNFHLIEKTCQRLFRVSGISLYVFLTSAICGYPIGAKIISELRDKNSITQNEAYKMSTFCCTSGVMFIMGTVGTLLKSVKYPIIILSSHLISALINGILFRNYGGPGRKKIKTVMNAVYNRAETTHSTAAPLFIHANNANIRFKSDKVICRAEKSKNHIDTTGQSDKSEKNNRFSLADDLNSSIKSILMIGGFISISYLLVDILYDLKIFAALEFLIKRLFVFLGVNTEFSNGFCCGLFEITRGIVKISEYSDIKTATALITFLTSFSGVSIILQCIAFLQKAGISTCFFLFAKFSHAMLSLIICLILVSVF